MKEGRCLFPHFTEERTKAQRKKSTSPRSHKQLGGVPRAQWSRDLCAALTAFLPSDAAFLAREKAKADAECYTAMKLAEANKVKPSTAW